MRLSAEDTQTVIAALPPQQVIYFQTSIDSENRTLDASTGNNYTITFLLPIPESQADSFWSLTLYNGTSLNLINNTINRYSIHDRVSTSCIAYQQMFIALFANIILSLLVDCFLHC